MTEATVPRRLAPLCEEHGSGVGTRHGCPYCALHQKDAALSRTDYLCGKPNEMGVSGYDVHCNEDAVVRHVEQRLAPPDVPGRLPEEMERAAEKSNDPLVKEVLGAYRRVREFWLKEREEIVRLQTPSEPEAWLVHFREKTHGGSVKSVVIASLEPTPPSDYDGDVASRELLSAKPLVFAPGVASGEAKESYVLTQEAHFCHQGDGCSDSWHVGGNYGSPVCRNPKHHKP